MTLSTAELARMRSEAERFLPGTAIIKGGTLTSDSGGGYTATYTARGTVACRLAPLLARRGTEEEVGGRINAEADVQITMPALTEIETDDQVTIAGAVYQVVSAPRHSWELTRRVEAKEVE